MIQCFWLEISDVAILNLSCRDMRRHGLTVLTVETKLVIQNNLYIIVFALR